MLELVGLALLLYAFASRPSSSSAPEAPATASPPPEQPKDPGKALLDAALTLAPVVPALLGGGGTLAGGAAPLGAAAPAAAAPAAPAAAAPAPAAAAPAAAAPLVGTVFVGIVANPFTWIVVIAICNEIAKAQQRGRDFTTEAGNLFPNARALHEFERAMFNNVMSGISVTTWEERDWRLDKLGADKTLFQGWRTVKRWVPTPADATLPQKLRLLGYEYLRERSWRGAVLRKRWTFSGIPQPVDEFGRGLWEFRDKERDSALSWAMFNFYERSEPGMGGLRGVPLINGRTQAPRSDKGDLYPPYPELLAPAADQDVARYADAVDEPSRKVARLMGCLDALKVTQYDPGVILPGDWKQYRDDVFYRFGFDLDAGHAKPVSWTDAKGELRHGIELQPEIYGLRVVVDTMLVKQGKWVETTSTDAGTTTEQAVRVLA